MVKANERLAVPNKRIEGPNKRIQVPKGIPIDLTSEYRYLKGSQLGRYLRCKILFKYNKKLFAWQRNPSWSSQLRRNKFVALVVGLGLGKISGQAIKCLIRYSHFI